MRKMVAAINCRYRYLRKQRQTLVVSGWATLEIVAHRIRWRLKMSGWEWGVETDRGRLLSESLGRRGFIKEKKNPSHKYENAFKNKK